MIQINRKINLLFTVGFPQLSEEKIEMLKLYIFLVLLLFSPLLILNIILDVSVSDNNGSISVRINKEALLSGQ